MPDKKINIKTRFAPSPTGAPHVGNIRTALFAFLFARASKGKFLLRIEDTDQSRSDASSLDQILESLKWLGITIDEGVISLSEEKGESGPYTQSKRIGIYKKYAEQLVKDGNAYYCFCTQERLEKLREEATAKKMSPKYDGLCLKLDEKEIADKLKSGIPHVVRMKIPDTGETKFLDLIKGDIVFKNGTLDHQVLLKSDGFPTYHLACVVDDHLMGITHVIRADEWLASTPKHVLLYKYFGWNEPQWAHLPVILGTDKSKLSKRHGAVSVLEYQSLGYLPDAVVNYLALLGWNSKTEQEIFTRQELIDKFDLKKINKNNPIFDITKLNWIGHQHMQKLSINEVYDLVKDFAKDQDQKIVKKAVGLVQDRMEKLTDFVPLTSFLWDLPKYNSKILIPKKSTPEKVKKYLEEVLNLAEEQDKWIEDDLRKIFLGYCDSHQLKRGDFLWPLRVALTGLEKSPETFAVMGVLGKDESVARIKKAIEKIA